MGAAQQIMVAQSISGGASFQRNQTFETPTTGYDNGETWTSFAGGGTIDPVYAVSPIQLTQSLLIEVTGANQAASYNDLGAGQDSYNVKLRMRLDSHTGEAKLVIVDDNAFGTDWKLQVSAAGKLQVSCTGSGTNVSTDSIPLATDIYVWLECDKGTGANQTVKAGFATTDSKPTLSAGGAKSCAITNGTGTNQPRRIFLGTYSSETMKCVYDVVQVAATPIT